MGKAMVRVTVVMMKHHDQSNSEKTGFISLTVPCNSSSSKTVRTGTQAAPEAGADAEA